MGFLDSIFKRKNKKENEIDQIFGAGTQSRMEEERARKIAEAEAERRRFAEAEEIQATLPQGQLSAISLENDVIDTTSPEAIAKFKHNLNVLMQKAEQEGKVDKFKIIREDDFFPEGWKWDVLSKNTNIEKQGNSLTIALKRAYALEQAGYESSTVNSFGMRIPSILSREEEDKLMEGIDNNISLISVPSVFRSTKHYTVNTPLEATGSYNNVRMERNYIVIDGIDNFLNSGYAYSMSHRDAYLDVSHESLPISENAVVLISDDKYESLMSDEKTAKELAQRRVIRYKGDTAVAISMTLTEMGVLPSQVDSKYATYSENLKQILENSIKDLAEKNGLFYDKSHSAMSPENGHFSDFYDRENKDHLEGLQRFSQFLVQKFPEFPPELFDLVYSKYGTCDFRNATEIVEQVGTTDLLDAITEYNNRENERIIESRRVHNEQRDNITPEVHNIFTSTVSMINEFYKTTTNFYDTTVKGVIAKFFHSDTPNEQLAAAIQVQEMLRSKDVQMENVTMESVTRQALMTALPEEIKDVDQTLPEMQQNQSRLTRDSLDNSQRTDDELDGVTM